MARSLLITHRLAPSLKPAREIMKNRGLAIVLAIFLGGLGIHRFYVGKIGSGFLFLIFCWTFVPIILGIIDAIRWSIMGEQRFGELYNYPPTHRT